MRAGGKQGTWRSRRAFAGCLAALGMALAAVPVIGVAGHAEPPPADDARASSGIRVANFAAAERMDGGYPAETLAFQTGPEGREIRYRAGGGEPLGLRLLEDTAKGEGFSVALPGGSVWRIGFQGDVLTVDDGSGGRPRLFLWHYEGPVDGRGTFCGPCVPETEAIAFVRRHFAG